MNNVVNKNWFAILMLVLVGFLMTLIFYPQPQTRTFLIVVGFSSALWISLWMGNAYLSDLFSRWISWQTRPLLRMIVGFIGMLIYTVSAVYILMWGFSVLFGLNTGSFTDMLVGTIIVTTVITLFMTGRSFLFYWRDAAVKAERLQQENVKAQYENLRSQVNPHFLFNSLNALTNLVYTDPDKAARFIKQLSDVYRFILDTRDKELITLAEELDFLNAFIYLQQIRCGDKLRVEMLLDDEKGFVAPMALQMLVENAIKHNSISADQPFAIHIFKEGDYIIVKNALQERSRFENNGKGLGLENIKKRYALLSDKPVEVQQTATEFTVKIPLLKLEK
ncbi:MAG: sensor histidine kinase [Cyclobacteriaceae bacterium]